MIPQHRSKRVDRALVELCAALLEWNRDTGRESVFVLRESNYECRAISGSPVALPDVADRMRVPVATICELERAENR